MNSETVDEPRSTTTKQSFEDPLDEGFNAYKMGIPEDQCPYAVEDKDFWKWNEGWNLARRAELEEEHNQIEYYQFPN